MKKIALLLCTAMLATSTYTNAQEIEEKDKDIGEQVADTAKSPFKDFNLTRDDIHDILKKAKDEPYALPKMNCVELNNEINVLTDILGPDIDATVEEKNNYEKASSAAFNALNKTVQGAIPYRSWIRKISGAERHAKKLDAAINAGKARRSFLKGVVAGTCAVEVKKEDCQPQQSPELIKEDSAPEQRLAPKKEDSEPEYPPEFCQKC